jgi:hypothetical protein
MFYSAFNLSIKSGIDLPELQTLLDGSSEDIQISFDTVPIPASAKAKKIGTIVSSGLQAIWLSIPGVATFYIGNGNQINIMPEPNIDEDSLRVFLLGSALGILLLQRGHLVLHGNAIKIGPYCMVCVGDSGLGKSTLAAGFMRRGYPILSDDVVPINSLINAMPGYPRIKIWQDTADHFNINTQGLKRIRPDIPKFNLPLGANFHTTQLPIRWIFELHAKDQEEVTLERLNGMERFKSIYNNLYKVEFMQPLMTQAHFDICSKLTHKASVFRVTRPTKISSLNMLIDELISHMDQEVHD